MTQMPLFFPEEHNEVSRVLFQPTLCPASPNSFYCIPSVKLDPKHEFQTGELYSKGSPTSGRGLVLVEVC